MCAEIARPRLRESAENVGGTLAARARVAYGNLEALGITLLYCISCASRIFISFRLIRAEVLFMHRGRGRVPTFTFICFHQTRLNVTAVTTFARTRQVAHIGGTPRSLFHGKSELKIPACVSERARYPNDTSLARTSLVKRTAVADSAGLEMVTKP